MSASLKAQGAIDRSLPLKSFSFRLDNFRSYPRKEDEEKEEEEEGKQTAGATAAATRVRQNKCVYLDIQSLCIYPRTYTSRYLGMNDSDVEVEKSRKEEELRDV